MRARDVSAALICALTVRPGVRRAGSAETFRDEDVAYASRIWQAGGVAELHVWPGDFHGFAGIVPQAAVSQAAVAAPEAHSSI